MENVEKYSQLVQQLLQSWVIPAADDHFISDTVHRHFQILRTNYDFQEPYFFRVRIHVFIREDGKICILENNTDIEIGDYLLENGVPKSDILPAFIPQDMRQLAGYAL